MSAFPLSPERAVFWSRVINIVALLMVPLL